MSEKEFIKKMVEIMDTEVKISLDTVLDEIEEWDSLSYVAFLSLGATLTKRKISPTEVKEAKTIRDLYQLIASEK